MQAWEEAPLLDEIAVNAGYRATVINLGLVGIHYHRLEDYIQARGAELATTLGITADQLVYLCRVLLDEMRTRGALSRPLLQYNPAHVATPAHFRAAQWERRMRQPSGYPLTPSGEVVAWLDSQQVMRGITLRNAWRRPGAGGRAPSLGILLQHLLTRLRRSHPDEQVMVQLLDFVRRGNFLIAADLYGARDRVRLLQVNADVVRLALLDRGHPAPLCGLWRCPTRRAGRHALPALPWRARPLARGRRSGGIVPCNVSTSPTLSRSSPASTRRR